MKQFVIDTYNDEQTREIAAKIATCFRKGDVILMVGELAAGKTQFVKGVAEFFKYDKVATSPTFSIANFYTCIDNTILHIDFYRLESIDEFQNLGLDEYFEDSITFIEWGNELLEYFDEYFLIEFKHCQQEPNCRQLCIKVKGENLLDRFHEIGKIIQ
jgi:tRNA threonylcarbamoyladenosine biosynthesis protein TsaE